VRQKGATHAAAASQLAPVTTVADNPRTGRPARSIRPVQRASTAPSRSTRTKYRIPRVFGPTRWQHPHTNGMAVKLADLPPQPAGDQPAVELGLDHYPPSSRMQAPRKPQQG